MWKLIGQFVLCNHKLDMWVLSTSNHMGAHILNSLTNNCCLVVMGPVGSMLCSSQASGSPFWMSYCSRSRGYKWRDTLSTFMSELRINSWHALTKLLRNRVNKLTRCWIFPFEISSVHLSGWRHFCMLCLSKKSYLDDSAHEHLMIPHTNFEMFDDFAHEYCMHPRQLSVLI